MDKEYIIIKKDVLPDYFSKVLEVKKLLAMGVCRDISEAVKVAGISRSTYYKYKEIVFAATENESERKAVLSFNLHHIPGTLGRILSILSEHGANIYTISQNPPVGESAFVVISLIIENLNCDISGLIKKLAKTEGVFDCQLISMD